MSWLAKHDMFLKRTLWRAIVVTLFLSVASFTASAQSTSQSTETTSMSAREMAAIMQMNDNARIGKVMLDRLEWRSSDGSDSAAPNIAWDAQAWYGSDFNKLWLKSEGEHTRADTNASTEVLWDRIVSRWWSAQVGTRVDTNIGPTRTWAAIGIQGLAPYWFDTEATLYIGDAGRAAARIRASHDLRFTQRLILQSEGEINLYKKNDVANRIDSGVSDLQLGLRLRYEFRREFAPYLGCIWSQQFDDHVHALQLTLGLRIWF